MKLNERNQKKIFLTRIRTSRPSTMLLNYKQTFIQKIAPVVKSVPAPGGKVGIMQMKVNQMGS